MRWTRLAFISLLSFLFVACGALFKKLITLLLCSVFSFNSAVCSGFFMENDRAIAAQTSEHPSNTEAEHNDHGPSEVADICLFGVCAPVDLPAPIENLIESGLNEVAEQQLRSLLADEIPISGSEHEFYDSVATLPGDEFTPQLLPLNSLPPDTPIPPGDYEIPAHFYCTKVYTFDGRGNRFPLARLDGRMADVLSALYTRASYDNSVSTSDIQSLSWAIQVGMSYDELSDSQQALFDRLIPEYKDRMEKGFVDKLTGIINDVSRVSGARLPGVNEILDELGPVGDVASSMLQARQHILRTSYAHQALAQEFAPQQDVFLEGGAEETPWSKTRENVYMRFIAPDGAMDDGTIQVRVVGDRSSRLDSENLTVLVASLTPNGGLSSSMPSDVTAGNLAQDITQSVGVPEASRSQAITASLPSVENDGKCNLVVVLFLGFDGVSSGGSSGASSNNSQPSGSSSGASSGGSSGVSSGSGGASSDSGGEYRVNPRGGLGVLQSHLQEEMSKYPTVALNSQIYRWDGENTALVDIENAIRDKKADNIIIIGHSYGADSANSLAKTLSNRNVTINMLVQIDTVGLFDDDIPSRVDTLINYYQINDKTGFVEQNISGAENINANERFDKTLIHTTIDDSEALHQDIINRILAKAQLCSERENSQN